MKYEIETKITGDGWIQEMVCTFLNEPIATLVLQDTETKTYWHEKCIMRPKLDTWDDNMPAATIKQENNVVTVSCNGKRNWHSDYETNKPCLESLARTWQSQAKEWNRIHRYMKATLNPILTKITEDVEGIKHEADNEQQKRKHGIAFCKGQISKLLKSIGEVKETQADVLDCLDMDDNHISRVTIALERHTNEWFAHFSPCKENR